MYVTVTCPTCGVGQTQTHCDNCGKTITAAALGTVAPLVQQPNGGPLYLCGTCAGLPLVVSKIGNPEPTPIP